MRISKYMPVCFTKGKAHYVRSNRALEPEFL